MSRRVQISHKEELETNREYSHTLCKNANVKLEFRNVMSNFACNRDIASSIGVCNTTDVASLFRKFTVEVFT